MQNVFILNSKPKMIRFMPTPANRTITHKVYQFVLVGEIGIFCYPPAAEGYAQQNGRRLLRHTSGQNRTTVSGYFETVFQNQSLLSF